MMRLVQTIPRLRASAVTWVRCLPGTVIRSFLNADLPILHRLWIEHWAAFGPQPVVSEAQLEQAVLARTFFRADQLLVAFQDEVPVGWLQFCPSPSEPERYVIPVICLGQNAAPEVAGELLQEAAGRMAGVGARRIEVGAVRDGLFGYGGLDPIGHGVGIPSEDWRLRQSLEAAGYRIVGDLVAMTVSVPGFRPPVTREAMLFRRSTQIQTTAFQFQDPRQASGLSHLDVETASLIDRIGQTLASVNVWLSDPEAEVMSPSLMILDIEPALERGRLEAAEAYLIGAVIQTAAQRFVMTVETAVDQDQTELMTQLQALQFASSRQGSRWERELD